MTNGLRWVGFFATVAIVALLMVNIIREPARQQQALEEYHDAAITEGIDLYAVHCARCHGAAGEGLGQYRALNQPFIMSKDADELKSVIQLGRYATDMVAFGLDEGGPLTVTQIDNLVIMLQSAEWDIVQARVEELGLTPTEADILAAENATRTITIDQPAAAVESLSATLPLFVEHCSECHGEQGQGTAEGPELNNAYVRGLPTTHLTEVISLGVRNTKMEGFTGRLEQDIIVNLVALLKNWNRLDGDGEDTFVIATEDEIAAVTETGQQLFETWCGICHGVNGEGGAIAPSLDDIPQLPASFLVSRIRNGQNAMPPFGEADLSNGQLALVIEYAQNNIIGRGLPVYSDAEIEQGQILYTQHCAECHGPLGEGVVDAGPRINTVPPMRAVEITNFTRVGSLETPAIPSSVVSDQDLRLIVAYIHSLSR